MLGRSASKIPNRCLAMTAIAIVLTAVIAGKLFMLQIVNHSYYEAKASEDRQGVTELEPRRGEILIKDYHSEEVFRLATNTTLDTLFVDPVLIADPKLITDTLVPLVFDLEEEKKFDGKRIKDELKKAPLDISEEDLEKIMTPRTDEELKENHYRRLLDAISQKTRERIVIDSEPSPAASEEIPKLDLSGIALEENNIVAYPKLISNTKRTAGKIAALVNIPIKRLEEILEGKNRYVIIKRKIDTEISAKIKKLKDAKTKEEREKYRGIGLEEHTYRFYPEGKLAAQVVGFVDSAGKGQYGIEGYFDQQLRGQKGLFRTQIDASGQQVTIGKNIILKPAKDGDTIMLTLDRSIQMAVERKLERHMIENRADTGQVIIMEPKTGNIIAMAQYPTFDPNDYPGALELEEIKITDAEKERLTEVDRDDSKETYLYINVDTHDRIRLFPEEQENGKIVYYKYKNRIGSAAYKNMSITDPFEPGSVFKTVVMAAAIDDGDVTPYTTHYESGPIQVDEFEIHNAMDRYRGTLTMSEVIQYSSNIGMSFVAKKIGRNLMYNYMKKFGFGERTHIEFDGEHAGQIEDFTRWADSELITHAFGQGILVTGVQMINAYAAIANKGVLMEPHVVEKINRGDGTTEKIEPRAVGQAVTPESANIMSAILAAAVEFGVAQRAGVPGYVIAGKTGTAQTYKHGKPLSGAGTTIASILGFAPIEDPKFVMLVKMDKPRKSEWADATVAPLFSEIAEYLLQYYNIQPDKK